MATVSATLAFAGVWGLANFNSIRTFADTVSLTRAIATGSGDLRTIVENVDIADRMYSRLG